MRKILVAVLVGLGVFGLVAAGLFRFYAPSRAEKTPLDLDVIQVATGPAKLLNAATGQLEDLAFRATRRVRTDSALSDSKVTVVQETLCIVKEIDNPPECVDAQDPQHRLVSFTTDKVAADRRTAQSVNDPKYHTNIDGDATATHTGLTYKWPFHAKKTSYKFFDPISRQAPDARFIGTDKLKGMTMYKYEAVIDKMDLPVGPGIPGSYADTRTVWVEPTDRRHRQGHRAPAALAGRRHPGAGHHADLQPGRHRLPGQAGQRRPVQDPAADGDPAADLPAGRPGRAGRGVRAVPARRRRRAPGRRRPAAGGAQQAGQLTPAGLLSRPAG